MYKFKAGDKVRVKNFCSGACPDIIYTLIKYDKNILKTYKIGQDKDEGCTCEYNWILVSPYKKIIKEYPIVAFMKNTTKKE